MPLQRDADELFEAARAFIRVYQFRHLDHALRSGLTVVQAYVLGFLSEGAMRLTELAGALHLDKSTASRVVAGMERHGLIAWSRPADDGRAKLIVASREGKRRYERHRRAIVQENARLLATYAAPERRGAVRILRELAERAGGAEVSPSPSTARSASRSAP